VSEPGATRRVVSFGAFQCDLRARELYKNGIKVRLADQPFRLLAMLLERPGEVVTRKELQQHLWADSSFGDFNDGLNTAINKLRAAVDDNAENPRFIETLPRRGYRFVAEVADRNGDIAKDLLAVGPPDEGFRNSESAATSSWAGASTQSEPDGSSGKSRAARKGVQTSGLILAIVTAIVLVGAVWFFYGRSALSFNSRDSVLVADFDNQTGDSRFDQALESAFVVSLAQSRRANLFPRGRLESVLQMMGKSGNERVTPALGREICQREGVRGLISAGITRTGKDYELTAELIDPKTGETVRSYAERSYGEDHILDALDVIAADIRRDLGESLYQIHQADRPLPEVTTSSLVALKQYSEGTTLWHQGKFAQGATFLRAAVGTDPDFAMAHAALGAAYFSYVDNDPDRGRQEYEKALSLSSRTTDRERMIIEAEFADDQGHVDEADMLYRAYLGRYPDDWQVLLNYARLLRMHGRAAEAIAQYKEILRLSPDDPKTYIEMGSANIDLNNFPGAVSAYSEGFRLDPHWLVAGNIGRQYGMALIESGDERKAQQVFTDMSEKAQNIETRESGVRSLALLDMYHGRYVDAAKRFKQCLVILDSQAYLSVARVHLWLAFVAEGEGDRRAEAQQLDSAAQELKAIGPKVVFGAFVGEAYARAGLLDKAERIESMVAPLADRRSAEQSGYLHLLEGEIAVAQRNYDKGIELLMLSNKENATPLSSEALAHAYQQAGKRDDAIAAYERVLSGRQILLWEPQQRWLAAHSTLAADYLARDSQKDRAKAKQVLDQFLGLWQEADPSLPLLKQARTEYARCQQS
jgi:eukaryotic-like serine/threonine-protein kinase